MCPSWRTFTGCTRLPEQQQQMGPHAHSGDWNADQPHVWLASYAEWLWHALITTMLNCHNNFELYEYHNQFHQWNGLFRAWFCFWECLSCRSYTLYWGSKVQAPSCPVVESCHWSWTGPRNNWPNIMSLLLSTFGWGSKPGSTVASVDI